MWWSINITGVNQASWAFLSPALELQQGTDKSERHLHFNSGFVIFVLLSYGAIGVLRGHLSHFLSSRLKSCHHFLTVLEMYFILTRFGLFSFRQHAVSWLSFYVQVHNSQWVMFSSQGLGFFRLCSHQSDDSCTMIWVELRKQSSFCARLTTLILWDG